MSSESLLPSNATTQERAIEASIGRATSIASPLRDVWNPDACPAALLPWLAWALSIDAWKNYWPEHVKRARIRTAIDVQRRKGTAKSVHDVVAAFGGAVLLREWWQVEPRAVPHTFDMSLTVSGEGGAEASAQYVDDVIAEVERTKPVRSHFTFTQGVNAQGSVGIIAAARAVTFIRLEFEGS